MKRAETTKTNFFLKNYCIPHWSFKLPDAGGMSVQMPFDVLLCINPYTIALEMKMKFITTKSKKITPSSLMKPHQLPSLQRFDAIGDTYKAFVIIFLQIPKKRLKVLLVPLSYVSKQIDYTDTNTIKEKQIEDAIFSETPCLVIK